MPRRCGPCGDKRRNEIDRKLLEMELSGETFRVISREFGYHVDALRRHKEKHLIVDLSEIKRAKDEARDKALAKERAKELEQTKADVADGMAARLENAANFLEQLREVRRSAADLLDKAEEAEDLRAAGAFLRELREQIRLWAELEKKLADNPPQVSFVLNPEWIELRTKILYALDPFPEAKQAIVLAIRGPQCDNSNPNSFEFEKKS